jgi:hypothetical protein
MVVRVESAPIVAKGDQYMVRIIAHFTNDEKREIALKIMLKGSVTQSYV